MYYHPKKCLKTEGDLTHSHAQLWAEMNLFQWPEVILFQWVGIVLAQEQLLVL